MKPNIGIKDESSQAVATILSKVLADEYVLYTKTRNAHWNVEGVDFAGKHKLFESQYDELAETIDSVAERIRQIGHYVPATLKEFLELTHLSEKGFEKNDSKTFLKELLEDHESIIIFLRENIALVNDKYGDAGTSDFITGLMVQHEKTAWFLRAHL